MQSRVEQRIALEAFVAAKKKSGCLSVVGKRVEVPRTGIDKCICRGGGGCEDHGIDRMEALWSGSSFTYVTLQFNILRVCFSASSPLTLHNHCQGGSASVGPSNYWWNGAMPFQPLPSGILHKGIYSRHTKVKARRFRTPSSVAYRRWQLASLGLCYVASFVNVYDEVSSLQSTHGEGDAWQRRKTA